MSRCFGAVVVADHVVCWPDIYKSTFRILNVLHLCSQMEIESDKNVTLAVMRPICETARCQTGETSNECSKTFHVVSPSLKPRRIMHSLVGDWKITEMTALAGIHST